MDRSLVTDEVMQAEVGARPTRGLAMEIRGTDIYRSGRARGADERPKNSHTEGQTALLD